MNDRIIEGIFEGENMWGDDNRIYPVIPNYASKSKLVEGDRLKLIIEENGNFIFKQIKPVPRRQISGVVNEIFQVFAEGNTYNILSASLSYFKLQPGDKVSIILPHDGAPTWAALDKVMARVGRDEDKEL